MNVILVFTFGVSLKDWFEAGLLSREIRIYEEIIIRDQCRCSDEKIKFAIKNLSKKELKEIVDENGNVKIVCEFCKTERIFPS